MSDTNLDLDVDWIGQDESRQQVARVCVASACRFTRDGGAPTITVDCQDMRTLDAEITRLKSELDDIAARGREHFGEIESAPLAKPSMRPPQSEHQRLSTDLLVGDVMTTQVSTVNRNDDLALADELMKVGRFRHIIVLDDQEHVAGVISREDIVYTALAWSLGTSQSMHDKMLRQTSAKSVMRTEVQTTIAGAPLREAAQRMMENKIGCLPVVDGVRLVGVLTESDLLALITAA